MEYINEADRVALADVAESMSRMTTTEKEKLKAFFAGIRFAAESDPQIIKSLAKGGNRE